MRSITMTTLLRSFSLSIALGAAISPHLARAWNEGEVNTGKVAMIELGVEGSVGFQLEGTVKLCLNAKVNALLGNIDANAPGKKEMLAALMMAKATGMSVRVFAINQPADATATNLCPVAFVDLL